MLLPTSVFPKSEVFHHDMSKVTLIYIMSKSETDLSGLVAGLLTYADALLNPSET